VLLSSPPGPRPFDEFTSAARTLAQLLRWRGAAFTTSLERNLGIANFAEITGFLSSSGLVVVGEDGAGRTIEVPREKRKTLDFYKNNSIHFFLLPSLVAHAGLRGLARADLKD